ncbi:hypothetical protein niasHT_009932 [Heterodera trifolii]|uniref:Uncharacterized protein n=1 Tax=Heterodera trifolii TaxID=157864 RepID=A0ABD2MD86_9BILA
MCGNTKGFHRYRKSLDERQLNRFIHIHRPFLVVYTEELPAEDKFAGRRPKRNIRATLTEYEHKRNNMAALKKVVNDPFYDKARALWRNWRPTTTPETSSATTPATATPPATATATTKKPTNKQANLPKANGAMAWPQLLLSATLLPFLAFVWKHQRDIANLLEGTMAQQRKPSLEPMAPNAAALYSPIGTTLLDQPATMSADVGNNPSIMPPTGAPLQSSSSRFESGGGADRKKKPKRHVFFTRSDGLFVCAVGQLDR